MQARASLILLLGLLVVLAAVWAWPDAPQPTHTENGLGLEANPEIEEAGATGGTDHAGSGRWSEAGVDPADAGGRAAVASAEGDADAAFGWIGTLRDDEGAAVVGVQLRLGLEEFFWAEDFPSAQGVSDGAGGFHLAWPREFGWESDEAVGLYVKHPFLILDTLLLPPPASPPTEVEVRLHATNTRVQVTVLDVISRQPVGGLPVSNYHPDWSTFATTAADGVALLGGIGGETCYLEVDDHVAGELEGPWRVNLPQEGLLEVTVYYSAPPAAIELTAVDAAQRHPLTDASFHWLDAQRQASGAPLPSEGGVLRWLQPGTGAVTFDCEVRASGHLPLRVRFDQPLPPGPTLAPLFPVFRQQLLLQVLEHGQPVADARVHLKANGPMLEQNGAGEEPLLSPENRQGPTLTAEGQSDRQGLTEIELEFATAALPKLLGFQVSLADGREIDLGWLMTEKLGPQPWVFDLDQAKGEIRFRVVDEAGLAVADYPLRVYSIPEEDSALPMRARLSQHPWQMETEGTFLTDEHGRASTTIPAPSRFIYGHGEEDDREVGFRVMPGESHEVEIRLGSQLDISGRVVLAGETSWTGLSLSLHLTSPDGSPPPGTEGDFWWSWPEWTRARVGGDGEFRFAKVPPGRYRIANERFPFVGDPTPLVEAGQSGLEFHLAPLCQLTLKLVDAESGLPLEGHADAYAIKEGSYWYWADNWNGSSIHTFPALGEMWVIVQDSRYRYVAKLAGEWNTPGENREIVVPMHRGREVRVHMRPESALQKLDMLLFEGMSLEDPRQDTLAWGKESVLVLRNAPFEALRLRLLDDSGESLGPVQEIPAGQSDIEVVWKLNP